MSGHQIPLPVLLLGDCVASMRELPDASVDAVVTDPPYGISFMGKHWDRFDIDERVGKRDVSKLGVRLTGNADPDTNRKETARTASAFANAAGEAGAYDLSLGRYGDERDWSELGVPSGRDNRTHVERGGAMHAGSYDLSGAGMRGFQVWTEQWAREAFRVLKPGGYLLCFAATRTYHRMACGVEEAGFEIRDCIAWMFGSGFPKSLNLTDEHEGWGTALKPAHEPIVMARKPLAGTVAANVLEHGTGALNIDGCRIGTSGGTERDGKATKPNPQGWENMRGHGIAEIVDAGRWPANVALDGEAAALLDEQTGELSAGNHPALRSGRGDEKVYGSGWSSGTEGDRRSTEAGGASRFFYCAKVSRAERNAGLDDFDATITARTPMAGRGQGGLKCRSCGKWKASGSPCRCVSPDFEQVPFDRQASRNVHPTVKPLDLMRWLCRLVTPPGGTVLDPFLGSGSTGCAAALEGFGFIGCEREAEYLAIAEARIAFWAERGDDGLRIVRERDAATAKREKVVEAGQLDLLSEDAA